MKGKIGEREEGEVGVGPWEMGQKTQPNSQIKSVVIPVAQYFLQFFQSGHNFSKKR